MKIEVALDHEGDAWGAFAESPEIHGFVTATGRSREDVIAKFESALRFHVAGLREDGIAVPDVTQIAIREVSEIRELAAA